MNLKIAAIMVAAATCFAGTASAQGIKYNVSGAFSNGATFAGSFVLDPNGQAVGQFSDISIAVSGVGTLTSINQLGWMTSPTGVGLYGLNFNFFPPRPDSDLFLVLQADHNNLVVTSIANQALDRRSYLGAENGVYFLTRGSITAATSAVPEPATWMMMIAGFGAMGGALRRRQGVAATVRYV